MSITEWFKYSVFSNLSYVRWDAESTASGNESISAVVDAERSPESLAEPLFKGSDPWTIPSFHPNDDSGFAANVFRNGDEAVLAIRGTEVNLLEALPFVGETGWQDLLDADLHDISTYGFALDQTVSLFNYVMRLQASTTDDAVTQVELKTTSVLAGTDPGIDQPFIKISDSAGVVAVDTYYWLESGAPATGLGAFDGVSNVSVTGHSLGGHLSVMAIRLFPELFDQAITFNAPGFDPALSLELTDQFVNLFGQFLSIAPADTFADIEGRVTAIESESSEPGDDVSVVSSLVTGIPVGQEVLVHTENNSHSMDQMMDALAVQALVASLNPGLDVGQFLQLYDGASTDAGATEENLVSALAKVILGEEPVLEQVEAGIISHGDFADRVSIHNQIVDIESAVQAQGLILEPLWDKTPEELAALAQGSMAYRYAILNLDPFAVLGDESLYLEMPDIGSFLTDAHGGAYWLARSEMLLANFNLGLTDGELDDTGGLIAVYSDLTDGIEVTAVATDVDLPLHTIFAGEEGTGLQTITGSDEAESIFGGIGADRLAGGEGSDIIDGGAGSDVLFAGESTGSSDDGIVDRLEGGTGADFYFVGDGDVISDSDRVVADIVLSGWSVSVTYEWVSEGVFQSVDGDRTLEIAGDDALITVTNLPTPSTMVILNFGVPGLSFGDDDFGITLILPEELELPTSTINIVGSEHNDNPWEDRDDVVSLIGTDGSEGIAGLEGNDFIASNRGVDFVDAGPGNDVVMNVDPRAPADFGGDTFIGGPGSDALTGNAGGDWLLGGDGDDFIQGGGGGDLLSGGSGHEVISGGDGDDIIYGDSGNDVVDGDKGLIEVDARDWLYGGTGLSSRWLDLETVEPAGNGEPYGADSIWGGSGSDLLMGGVGDDKLYGGSGLDTLEGGYGDDLLDGGSDADSMSGDEGDDELHGGEGDDRLAGGYGQDVLVGGLGNDRYDYSAGDGWDRIREVVPAPAANNSILFGPGDYFGHYQLIRSDTDLVIQHLEDDAGIIVEGWFTDPESVLDEIQFDDRVWNIADMTSLAAGQGTRWSDVFYGSEEDDRFEAGAGGDYGLGGGGDDVIFGGDGADMLTGDAGNDALYGGDGSDFIEAGSGDDTLVAGENAIPGEADSLFGGEGSDTYVVDLGPGARTFIVESDVAGDDHDVIRLLGDVQLEDLAVRQVVSGGTLTSALAISFLPSVDGAAAEVTILSWFGNTGGEIEAIELDDGTIITAEEIIGRLNVPTNGRDYLLGAGETVILQGMAGDDQLVGNGERNELQGGAGSDQLSASGGENFLQGGDGSDQMQVSHAQPNGDGSLVSVDIMTGGDGSDVMESSAVSAVDSGMGVLLMDGGSDGDTLLVHGGWPAIIVGGEGFDSISGELTATDSVILLNRGDQGDVISSTGGWGATTTALPPDDFSHVLSFGGGITLGDISLSQDGSDLLILTGALEGLRLVDYFDPLGEAATWLTQIQIVNQATSSYESGSTSPSESNSIFLLDFNPIVSEYLQQRTGPDEVWRLADASSAKEVQYLPDAAIGGQVAYEYALLGSDVSTHLGDQVWESLRVVADASAPVAIQVLPTEPVAGVSIGPLQAPEDDLFQYRLPENFMVDPITQEVLPIALESNLPAWLAYDPLTRELTGSPSQQDIGTTSVSFSAANRFGQESTVSFDIVTSNTNDLPVVAIPAGIVTATAGEGFRYTLPTGMFSDEDPDDQLTISIAAPAGGAVPDWMQFDPAVGELSGTPPLSAVGDIAVVIVATDSAGGTASSTLTLTIEPGSEPDGEIITGTGGSDVIVGSEVNDTISGGDGSDELHGGGGDDNLDGGERSDSIFGGPGQDQLFGGTGADVLAGDDGDDVILGGQGRDRVFGGAGDDYLSGERGNDRLMGGDGDDVLVAEFGSDRLAGGAGNDTYEILAGAGKVTITDVSGGDAIHFDSVSSGDAGFSRQHDDLVLKIADPGAKVVITDWFSDPGARIESFVFSDSVTLLEQDVLQLVQQRAGFAVHAAAYSALPEFHMDTGFVPSAFGVERWLDGGGQEGAHR